MFLTKYVNEFNYNLIVNNYKKSYLLELDEKNFIYIYRIFTKYGFYFINSIIVNYLEIFEMDPELVIKGIEKLKNKLGDNIIHIVGNDMKYLNELLIEDSQ